MLDCHFRFLCNYFKWILFSHGLSSWHFNLALIPALYDLIQVCWTIASHPFFFHSNLSLAPCQIFSSYCCYFFLHVPSISKALCELSMHFYPCSVGCVHVLRCVCVCKLLRASSMFGYLHWHGLWSSPFSLSSFLMNSELSANYSLFVLML